MTSIILDCRGSYASAKVEGQITAGTVGLPVELHWDEEWDGLAKVLFFCNSLYPDRESAAVAAIDSIVTVPESVLLPGGWLRISAEGVSHDGKRVKHTQWADCGRILESGTTAELPEPEPNLVQQLLSLADQAVTLAREAKEQAGSGGGSAALDSTLTAAGKAAEAKAVGDAIGGMFTVSEERTVKLLTESDLEGCLPNAPGGWPEWTEAEQQAAWEKLGILPVEEVLF